MKPSQSVGSVCWKAPPSYPSVIISRSNSQKASVGPSFVPSVRESSGLKPLPAALQAWLLHVCFKLFLTRPETPGVLALPSSRTCSRMDPSAATRRLLAVQPENFHPSLHPAAPPPATSHWYWAPNRFSLYAWGNKTTGSYYPPGQVRVHHRLLR